MKREWLIGRFIVPTALFLSMIAVGATIYTKLEGWSVIDAVYFSVATATTLGYGDVVPVTVPGKIFTIIFAFLTIGFAFYFFTLVGRYFFTHKLKKEILESGRLKKGVETIKI